MVNRKKKQEVLHLRCYTLRKLFPFTDVGFQREPMSVACVKGIPDKHNLFIKIATINHIQGLFCLKFSRNSKPWILQKPPLQNLYLFRD